ncbi:MAG: zinc ribbon domain-containing protein [Ktedonobacteraceae bacterium]
MYRHNLQPEMLRGIGRFAFSILCGLVLTSQIVLPAHGLAISTRIASSASVPASQSLALSEVSVVRLVSSYTATGTAASNPVLCTSLGVLVRSIAAASASDPNTWVLTDGSLLSTAPAPCASPASSSSGKTSSTFQLSTITIYANNVYTGNGLTSVSLGTYTPTPNNGFLCFSSPCTNGASFFSFHTDSLQPTLDVATSGTIAQFAIALTNQGTPAAGPPVLLTNPAEALTFLSPSPVLPNALTNQSEVGMPLINQHGQMVGMHLQGNATLTSADYNVFVSQHAVFNNAPANPLQVAWKSGISAYYSHSYQAAIKDFQTVEALNPNFVAAKTFEQSAQALSVSQSTSVAGTTTPVTDGTTFFGIPKTTVLYVAGALVFLVLILLVIIFISKARRRGELSRSKEEQAEAQRKVEKSTQQRAQQEKTHVAMTSYEPLVQDNTSSNQLNPIINPPSTAHTICPNCGQKVPANAIYCATCGFPLTSREGNPLLTSDFPGIGKTQPESVISTLPPLTPIKEKALDDAAIQETLKRLWSRAER